jgi:hypothetical protein
MKKREGNKANEVQCRIATSCYQQAGKNGLKK